MKFIAQKHVWQLLSLLGLDVLVFMGTDAAKVPSFMAIIGFGLLALTIYQLIYGLLKAIGLYGLVIKRPRPLARYLTAIVGGLIALQSIGELSQRDVLVVLPLAILGYLYSAYAKTIRRNLGG